MSPHRMKPTVVIAEDHKLMAEGLSLVLAGECSLLEVVNSAEQLAHAAMRQAADVLVMDVNLGDGDAIDTYSRLKSQGCRSKAVFITADTNPFHLRRAIGAGGSAFILKSSAGSDLIVGIRSALEGRTYIAGFDAAELMRTVPEPPAVTARRLTPRQRAVLNGFAQGLSAKQIADDMKVTQRTVEYHKYELMKLAGVSNGPALILWAERAGRFDQRQPRQ